MRVSGKQRAQWLKHQSDFCEYVMEFYGPNGIYPKGFTTLEIAKATRILGVIHPLEYDSLDRERVRDIVLELRN